MTELWEDSIEIITNDNFVVLLTSSVNYEHYRSSSTDILNNENNNCNNFYDHYYLQSKLNSI